MKSTNKLTKEEVIKRFHAKHGDKFDYSKFEYDGMNTPACIICPIHGEFEQRPTDHLAGKHGCKECGIEAAARHRKDTTDSFISKAEKVHGKGSFDYSLVEYKGQKTHIEIICKYGHHFFQSPNSHLNGRGCSICKAMRMRTKKGSPSIEISIKENYKAYRVWSAMIERCYGLNGKPKYPSYNGVKVCNEWRYSFPAFLEWHNQNYVHGWQLDKDLLSSFGNIQYSPQTCCYLPLEINRSLHKKNPKFTMLNNKFRVDAKGAKGRIERGCYPTYKLALAAYRTARAERMVELADKYKSQLSDKAYNALMNLYK